jgi:hypothetical protein
MKHLWVLDTSLAAFLGPRTRTCSLCLAVQHEEQETWWGRIIARHWRPLVGRCPGKPQV